MRRGLAAPAQTARSAGRVDYRRGTMLALASTVLFSVQAPLSALAAENLSPVDFLAARWRTPGARSTSSAFFCVTRSSAMGSASVF